MMLTRHLPKLLLAAALCARAQTAAPDKAKQVIDAALAALGGPNYLSLQTRLASGRVYSFFHDQLSGLDLATVYTEYLAPTPAATTGKALALRERELLGKKKDYSYLFLPDQGWDVTYRGARPIPDDNWDRYVRTTENDILYIFRTRLNEPGMTFDYIGNQVYLSRHIDAVDVTDSQNRTLHIFFDYNTKLPIRETFEWLDPLTKERNEEVYVFDKYRDIGNGVQWPFDIQRERNGYKSYQFFADKITGNVAIPPGTFDLPKGAKVLRKVN